MYRAEKNEKDIRYILDNLRLEDLQEVKSLYGVDWKQKVFENIMRVDVIIGKTKKADVPALMGGVSEKPDEKGIGIVWLLSTNEIKKILFVSCVK